MYCIFRSCMMYTCFKDYHLIMMAVLTNKQEMFMMFIFNIETSHLEVNLDGNKRYFCCLKCYFIFFLIDKMMQYGTCSKCLILSIQDVTRFFISVIIIRHKKGDKSISVISFKHNVSMLKAFQKAFKDR